MTDGMNDDLPAERRDLLEALRMHRALFRRTLDGLTDEQARLTPTASELSLAALVKHVAATESAWIDFVERGPEGMAASEAAWLENWTVGPADTVEALLRRYDEVARRTDEVAARAPDLDLAHPLPPAPWFPPGATRSIRRVLIHIVAETAQHAGHADIIRETIDGAKTMG